MLSPKRQCAISVGSQIPNSHQQIKFANSGIVAATAVALSNKHPHPSAILNPVTAQAAVAVAHPSHFAPHNLFVQRQQHQINATATTQHYQQYTPQPFITATTVNPTTISNIQISNEEANNLTTITSSNISSKVKLINSSGALISNSNTNPETAQETNKMDNQMTLAPLGLSQSMDSVNTASNEEEVSCAMHMIIFIVY